MVACASLGVSGLIKPSCQQMPEWPLSPGCGGSGQFLTPLSQFMDSLRCVFSRLLVLSDPPCLSWPPFFFLLLPLPLGGSSSPAPQALQVWPVTLLSVSVSSYLLWGTPPM